MHRILYAVLDILIAAAILIPALLICNRFRFHSHRKTVLYGAFTLYLIAVCSLVGFPGIHDFYFDPACNPVPFRGMVSDLKNCILNVLLFIPLGILLPVIWPRFDSLKSVLLWVLCFSTLIELMQLFNFRTTDINDLITNTGGAALGYLLIRPAIKKHPKLHSAQNRSRDSFILCASVLVWVVLISPVLAYLLSSVL